MNQKDIARFWAKVDRRGPAECWPWLSGHQNFGYGCFRLGLSSVPAHRVAYEIINGKIPVGLEIDHLCRNTNCVNPSHLEAVTHRENILRGNSPMARAAKVTCCPKGHPYDDDNTIIKKLKNGRYGRECRICKNESNSLRYYRRKDERTK